jgi:hypothetical protein
MSLTKRTMVLITRIGDIWIEPERGQKIMKIKNADAKATIEIDGSWFASSGIEGLLTAQQYADLQNKRRGMWQCGYQKWHNRDDVCYCAREVATKRPLPEVQVISDEERARVSEKFAKMRANLVKKKGV